ncbi:MAG TPA: glycosyltransferase, partial [Anaerolineaceae bacterium]|nr:glycosyltransferase [Anaerolineaceae bacterium]
ISDAVFLGGVINQIDLPKYYHASDLYISASFSDGSSVSLLEALACGLPVLVSDIPGNKEWIIDQENGWLFQTGDIESLTKKILDVNRKKNDLTSIKKLARITAEEKANWKLNFEKLLNAYHMVLIS